MARYKPIDTSPRLIAVDLERQVLPGRFEFALNHLLDHELDLSHFDTLFRNDSNGAPTWPPEMLLKVVLFAFTNGILGSRPMARACMEHVTFIALCGDAAPHFTTIANFAATMGGELFAIDSVKLPTPQKTRAAPATIGQQEADHYRFRRMT